MGEIVRPMPGHSFCKMGTGKQEIWFYSLEWGSFESESEDVMIRE
jgi:hypothetical protein